MLIRNFLSEDIMRCKFTTTPSVLSANITFILADAVWCEISVLLDSDSVIDWQIQPTETSRQTARDFADVMQLLIYIRVYSAGLHLLFCLCPPHPLSESSPPSSSSFYFSFTRIRVSVLSNWQLRGTLHRSVRDCWRQWECDGVQWGGGVTNKCVLCA